MRIAFPLAVFLLMMAGCGIVVDVPAPEARNLFKNPSFEDGLNPWTHAFGGAGTSRGIDSTVAYSGQNSYFVQSNTTDIRVGVVQNVETPQPGRYKLGVAFKTQDLELGTHSQSGVVIRVQYQDEGNQSVKNHQYFTLTKTDQPDWKTAEVTIDVPAETHRVRVEFYLSYAKGKAWWDDAFLEFISET